jgi:hypothetical protein
MTISKPGWQRLHRTRLVPRHAGAGGCGCGPGRSRLFGHRKTEPARITVQAGRPGCPKARARASHALGKTQEIGPLLQRRHDAAGACGASERSGASPVMAVIALRRQALAAPGAAGGDDLAAAGRWPCGRGNRDGACGRACSVDRCASRIGSNFGTRPAATKAAPLEAPGMDVDPTGRAICAGFKREPAAKSIANRHRPHHHDRHTASSFDRQGCNTWRGGSV